MDNVLSKNKIYNLLFLESNQMFHQLIEENHAGVYIADEQGNLLYVNSAFVGILGYFSKDDLLGKNLAKELYAVPVEREGFLQAMEKTGFVRDYKVRNKRKDGSVAVLSVTSNWIRDDGNRIIGVEGIVHDVTEKERIEKIFQNEKDSLVQILNFEESASLIHDVKQLGKFAVQRIAGILNAQKCSLMLYDKAKDQFSILAAKGLDESIIDDTHKKMGEPIAGVIGQKREPVLVTNIEYDKQFRRANRPGYSTRSFISAPILFGPKLLGVINATDKFTHSWEVFSEMDLKVLCMMARAVGIALENASMFQRLENLTFGEPWISLR